MPPTPESLGMNALDGLLAFIVATSLSAVFCFLWTSIFWSLGYSFRGSLIETLIMCAIFILNEIRIQRGGSL